MSSDPARVSEPEAVRRDEFREELAAAQHVLTRVPGARSPLVLFDRDVLGAQVELWRRHLAFVEPYFAIKACNVPAVLQYFDALGLSFDAANAGEIRMLEGLGVAPERVVVTHPIRDEEDLRAIARYKPRSLVVDGPAELRKLQHAGIPGPAYAPELLVRVELPFGGLSGKYGATVAQPIPQPDGLPRWQITDRFVRRILEEARKVERESGFGFSAFGLSAHVGTNSTSVDKYLILLRVFEHLSTRLAGHGFDISVFDVGGGYPDLEAPMLVGATQAGLMAQLGHIMGEFAAAHPRARLVAEPGRFLVSSAGSIVIGVMQVDKRRNLFAPDGTSWEVAHLKVQMNDGLYGNLLGERHDDKDWRFVPLRTSVGGRPFSPDSLPAVLHGKTCDSWDQVLRMRSLPLDLAQGDHLVVPHAGAYTVVTATDFNSAPRAQVCLHGRNADGTRSCALYDATGRPVLADGETPVQRPVPTYIAGPEQDEEEETDNMPSGLITLSGVLGLDASRVDRGLLHPRGAVGDARWRAELALVWRNDITLRLARVEPLTREGEVIEFRGERAALPYTVLVRIGAVPRDRAAADRFRVACAAMRGLPPDPKFAPVLESGLLPEGGNAYCIEPFLAGRTLEDLRIDLRKTMDLEREPVDWRAGPPRTFLKRLESAARALHAVHKAGAVHGDVRPRNIIALGGGGARVVLRKWGVLGVLANGVGFARPEEVPGWSEREHARAADVAGLGAALHAATCPRDAPVWSPAEALAFDAAPTDPAILPAGVFSQRRNEELAQIVSRALGTGRCEPWSAIEFAGALKAYLAAKPS